jgi:Uma2 family endonuclease
MSSRAEKKDRYTVQDYLTLEEKAEFKSEFVDGEVFAMAGGTEAHIQISFNVTKCFAEKLRGKCRAYQSEMKVWIENLKTFFYPDVTLVCGERKFYKNRQDIIENPVLLVEVLSESTEKYDKNDKFLTYQSLESFQEYVLISQNKPVVQQYLRQTDGSWKYLATIGLESEAKFESVGVTLKLTEIYDLIEFEED